MKTEFFDYKLFLGFLFGAGLGYIGAGLCSLTDLLFKKTLTETPIWINLIFGCFIEIVFIYFLGNWINKSQEAKNG